MGTFCFFASDHSHMISSDREKKIKWEKGTVGLGVGVGLGMGVDWGIQNMKKWHATLIFNYTTHKIIL